MKSPKCAFPDPFRNKLLQMILITGATGIVGSHILIELLQRGNAVRVLLRPSASREPIVQLLRHYALRPDSIEYVAGDINDPVSLGDAVRGCEAVYHCAAMVSFDPTHRDRLFMTNVRGTANVVDACLAEGVKALCYISSTAAIGDELINGEHTEESKWTTDKGRSYYAISKRFAELEVYRGRQEGLQAVILNPGIIIGPGKWGQSSTKLILSCRKGMRFYPPGVNSFVDVRDVARFAVDAVAQGYFAERYLMVGEVLPFKDLFTSICEKLGTTPPSVALPRTVAMAATPVLRVLETMRLNRLPLTSESLRSACRRISYNARKAREAGVVFTPVSQAVDYTVEVYRKYSL